MTASGCGVQVKDYGHLLRDDARYAAKAERIAGLARDVAEVVAAEGGSAARAARHRQRGEPRTTRRLSFAVYLAARPEDSRCRSSRC